MPEGHTIHRLALLHQEMFGGRVVHATSPQGRFAAGAARLDGRVVTMAEAHGKHLLVGFDAPGGDWLHVHLGLYGTYTFHPLEPDGPQAPEPVGAVRLRLSGAAGYADLRGPTACELLTPPEVGALHARLGPDPLREEDDGERAWQRISRSRTPVAAMLMDQAVLAGVGNVYRAEVLFRQGVRPRRPGRDLSRAEWDAIWSDLAALMREGVRLGHIDTVRPEHTPEAMGRPPREDGHGGEVYVYRRTGQPCLVCGTEVRTEVLAARNLYWCPTCQHD